MRLPNAPHFSVWLWYNWDTVSWRKIKSFLAAYWRMNKQENQVVAEGQAQREEGAVSPDMQQFTWRKDRVALLSPQCLNKQCIHCGCDTPDKFWEQDGCEMHCFPEWMPKEDWAEFKNQLDNPQHLLTDESTTETHD